MSDNSFIRLTLFWNIDQPVVKMGPEEQKKERPDCQSEQYPDGCPGIEQSHRCHADNQQEKMQVHPGSEHDGCCNEIEETGTHNEEECRKGKFLMDQAESGNSREEVNAVYGYSYRLLKHEKYRSV